MNSATLALSMHMVAMREVRICERAIDIGLAHWAALKEMRLHGCATLPYRSWPTEVAARALQIATAIQHKVDELEWWSDKAEWWAREHARQKETVPHDEANQGSGSGDEAVGSGEQQADAGEP